MIRTPLINSKGVNTSALFGFSKYLLHVMEYFPGALFAATFDSKGPTLRKQRYDAYKANRSEVPEDLKVQLGRSRDLAKALGIACFHKDGYEADDIIKDIAFWGRDRGYEVKIVSKDKDLMQLVDDTIHLFAPAKNNSFTDIGPTEVFEKMGVYPDRVVDLLALMGDSSDNIPGIPGVGPKTAVKILNTCDNVQNLIDNPSCAHTQKISEKIRENLDKLKISLELVQFHDTGIAPDEEILTRDAPVMEEVTQLFDEFEFESLYEHSFFEDMPEVEKKSTLTFSHHTVTSLKDLSQLVETIQKQGYFSFDTETTSLDCHDAQLVGISLALEKDKGYYIPLAHDEKGNLPVTEVLKNLRVVLEDSDVEIIGQNLKYDMQVLFKYGIHLQGIIFDTMIAAYLVSPDEGRFNLDFLARKWLNYEMMPIEDLIGTKKDGQLSFAQVSRKDAAFYAAEDAVLPLVLKDILLKELEESDQKTLFYTIESPLIAILASMEYTGFRLDTAYLNSLRTEYVRDIAQVEKEIFDMAGESFNLNSPKQLAAVLFEKLRLPAGRKTKTGYSTAVEVLEKLAPKYPIVEKILCYREKQKLYSTYINALPHKVRSRTGRLHTSLKQTGTATGRISSRDPNLQNIPVKTSEGRMIRKAFVADDTMRILCADYSQIELRLLAHFSRDPILVTAFKNGADIHRETAAAFFEVPTEFVSPEMRRTAKVVNFGLMYGMGAYKLSTDLNIPFGRAKEFISRYFEQFATVKDFMDESIQRAREKKYSETLMGRKRWIQGLNASNQRVREAAQRLAVNTPVQGSAADIIKKAMIDIEETLRTTYPDVRPLLQVHDELIFEVPGESAAAVEKLVCEKMEQAVEISVPLDVSSHIADNWSDAH
jgi:DNA polymerase-1